MKRKSKRLKGIIKTYIETKNCLLQNNSIQRIKLCILQQLKKGYKILDQHKNLWIVPKNFIEFDFNRDKLGEYQEVYISSEMLLLAKNKGIKLIECRKEV